MLPKVNLKQDFASFVGVYLIPPTNALTCILQIQRFICKIRNIRQNECIFGLYIFVCTILNCLMC